MNKKDLVNLIFSRQLRDPAEARDFCVSKNATSRNIETILDIIKENLKKGEKVSIGGFGIFRVVERKGKRVRNPRTGKIINISPYKTICFQPSKNLKSLVNKN